MVLDSYAPNPPRASSPRPQGNLGRGPLLARAEEGSGLSKHLEVQLKTQAKHLEIPFQSVDLGRLHDGKPFIEAKVAVLGAPVRFPGTPAEMIDLDDLETLRRWLVVFLEEDE